MREFIGLSRFLFKRAGVLTVGILLAQMLYAQQMTVNNILYNVLSTEQLTVEVAAGQNPAVCGTSVSIPSEITYDAKTWKVKAVGENAFSWYNPTQLLSVELGYNVSSIGASAFAGCRNLTSISGTGVKEIGAYAFQNCSSLTSTFASSNITTIGNYAYMGCTSLTNASIGEDMTSIGIGVYKNCTGVERLYIGHSVQIPDEFCYGCTNLSTITYEETYTSVSAVGAYAFYNCGELASLRTASNCQFGDGAFQNCVKLSKTISSTTASIGSRAFMNCKKVTRAVDLRGDIGMYAFSGSGLTEVSAQTANIGNGAFSYCEDLTSASLSNVKILSGGLFSGCSLLSTITLPSNYTSIGDGAFSGCESLTSFTIPQTVSSIGNDAFNGCSGLSSIIFKGNMPELGDRASSCFYDCPLLTNIYYPAYDNSYYTSAVMQTGNVSVGSAVQRTLHPQITLQKEWNSYCASASYEVPDGIEAYVVKSSSSSTVTLKKVNTINQGEGLLLKPVLTGTSYEATRITSPEAYSSNMLVGVTTATDISTPEDGFTNFILKNGEFCKGTGTLAAFKAYLPLPTEQVASSRMLQLVFEDDTTGVSIIGNESETGVWYDILGCRYASKPTKSGLYIVNGKKVIIK